MKFVRLICFSASETVFHMGMSPGVGCVVCQFWL